MVVTHAVMRFLVAGLVLIAVGIGLTEYNRRTEVAPAAGTAKKTKPKSVTPPTTKALMETVTAEADVPVDGAAFAKAVSALASDAKADGFTTVLSGAFTARELVASDTFAVAIVGSGETTGLVRIAPGAPATPVVARKNAIGAVAIDGESVWWSEGGRVLMVGTDGAVKVKAQFATATVTGLAVSRGVAVATLVPKDGDPFSTDPTGAVVKIEGVGAVTVVVAEQVRPHDVLLHGSDAFFVAGYPSALVRAALDGSFSSQIAARADGPLAFDGEGVVHRVPATGSPEVRRVALAGGGEVTLTHGDVDWLAAADGVTRYTTVGIGARVYEVSAGQDPKEVVAFKGVAKGLAMVGEHLLFSATADDGTSVIRVK